MLHPDTLGPGSQTLTVPISTQTHAGKAGGSSRGVGQGLRW